MSTYVDKPLSLIEKKKLQWAKEREELAGLSTPWSTKESEICEKPLRYVNFKNEVFRKDHRRSSLPPLYKNQYNSMDREMGGETSGYGSDNPNPYGYESSSSFKDDRPKWRDKNRWEGENDPPNWVKRGLQRDEEIIVSNTSPAESPEIDPDRPYTSSSGLNRSYIRGQNIPVDSTELAERERRRQVALAHQEAVRQQLEDRERRRREEREKRIKEEQEEELRIEREQEIERKRREEELKLIQEKQERERKRKEAIEEAIEIAEKEAKLERMKQRKQNNIEVEEKEKKNLYNNMEKENKEIAVLNNELEVKSKALSPRIHEKSDINSPRNDAVQLSTPKQEMTFVVQTPLENLQNMQYVLMPNSTTPLPIAIPVFSSTPRTENRILTPTQYRNRNKNTCDSSTQTDPESKIEECNNQKYVRERTTNLELNFDNRRKERRTRSGERSVEERPKWGANRPPTRYMKQSEKDPLYQRRKLRQKMREVKVYDDKNSSDDSQCSPRSYRKNYVEKRHRALWRKNDHFFARNIRMYQTEIVPLESDREQIYLCECCCKCNYRKSELVKLQNSPRDRLPNCDDNRDTIENAAYLINRLTDLHNGLMMKQEEWERSPRTPTLSSSTRNTENNQS